MFGRGRFVIIAIMRWLILTTISFFYRNFLKRILFLQDPEKIHHRAVRAGEWLGESKTAKTFFSFFFRERDTIISQRLFNIQFDSPIGLSAGFDYEARLTQILPCLGFGFGSVGTLTYLKYEGNPRPMLGRLPKSRSLMVNKGFKNLGVAATLERLNGKTFTCPVGISIGKTNTEKIATQRDGIEDVVNAFRAAEQANVSFSYYELNISCPNLKGTVEFYDPIHLKELLSAIGGIGISRPVWIKIPISKTDSEIMAMMDIIVAFPFIEAVIFGNLQQDRNHPALNQDEVKKFPHGNFSGLPCRDKSDELICLAFKNYGSRIKIVGCGGVFSATDAYRKIKLGASLVELITGLIFEGPQLVSQINYELAYFLRRDGYRSITEAIGRDA